MDDALQNRITKYVNPEHPLGPADAHLIKDEEVAFHLFDPHNESFNLLLRKNISVVIGRRGSGKTALLNNYLYRSHFQKTRRSRALDDINFDLNDYSVVIPVIGNRLFEQMQSQVSGPSGLLRPIESVIEDWAALIIDYLLVNVLTQERGKHTHDGNIETIEKYVSAPDIIKKVEAHRLIFGQTMFEFVKTIWSTKPQTSGTFPSRENALRALVSYLSSRKTRAIVIFDSMDEYEVGNAKIDRIVGALLRFVGQFNFEHDRVKIKLGLPSEIFPEIQRASANPLKDFVSYEQLRWTATELAQIAAYRYRLFLEIFDPNYYPEVASIDLNSREGARRFWDKFFTERQVNRYGHQESAMTYMLRHTQLLPRQLFRILQRVIVSSQRRTGGYRLLTREAVVDSIESMEPIIAGEIIQGFKHVYPPAESLGRAIFGNFPTLFSYDQLEMRWRRVGRAMMRELDPTFELVHFTEMLLRMGIMGVKESETERYLEGKFAYNMLMPFSIGAKLLFVIHPIFSRYFGCAENEQRKSILPQGTALDAVR
jgi:hypothetical protein